MYQWRDLKPAGSGAVALPRGFAPALPRPPERLSLVVDLAEDLFSARWWRGAATLILLCGAAGLTAPKFEPIAAAPTAVDAVAAREYRAAGVAPLSLGGRSGSRMVANDRVEALTAAPERAQILLDLRLGAGDRLDQLLARMGARPQDAADAARRVHSAAPRGLDPGTAISLRLGKRDPSGLRPVERLALRVGMDLDLTIVATSAGLQAQASRIAIDSRPRRIRGRVGDGLYWSLRSSGVSPAAARDYLAALATRIDVGADLGADDRFDLVIAHRRSATGQESSGPLLYAGIQRLAGPPLQMLRWSVGGRTGWYDAASLTQVSSGAMGAPVNAPVTSNFGMRYHPILRFARMHRGMDFGARWGSPIFASADGAVSRAGWAGGYGRQVRLVHNGGIATSYSHMSRMVVAPGMTVRQGQLIGYVGSSGLSTGPHLHYETYRGGVAVDPRSVRFAGAATIDRAEVARFKARVQQLLGTGRAG